MIWSPFDRTVPAQILRHSQFTEVIITEWILNEKIPILSLKVPIQFSSVGTTLAS